MKEWFGRNDLGRKDFGCSAFGAATGISRWLEGSPKTCGGVNQPRPIFNATFQIERLTGERFRIYYEHLCLLTFWCCQVYCA
jgi:hypothetical protein